MKLRSLAVLASLLVSLAPALLATGCIDYTRPFGPHWRTTPLPTSPQGVVRVLQWCWKHREVNLYEPIFTDDFRFVFAEADSAGNAYRDVPWTREDELAMARNLFVGNDTHSPASDIQIDFDDTLVPLPDERPGKNPAWHQAIRTRADLRVTFDRGNGPEVCEVHGYARFYVVRGDSAAIPPELVARGYGPDPGRWWIERWDDETLPGAGTHAQPVQNRTWGGVKTLFR